MLLSLIVLFLQCLNQKEVCGVLCDNYSELITLPVLAYPFLDSQNRRFGIKMAQFHPFFLCYVHQLGVITGAR